jgi:hypothetical protein
VINFLDYISCECQANIESSFDKEDGEIVVHPAACHLLERNANSFIAISRPQPA